MKKFLRIMPFILGALFVLTTVSCSKKAKDDAQISSEDNSEKQAKKQNAEALGQGVAFNIEAYNEEKPEYKPRSQIKMDLEDDSVSYSSLNNFFTLDYTPEYPDVLFNDKQDKKSGKIKADAKDTSESVIPGIRKLTDYITKYTTKKGKLAEYKPSDEPEEASEENANKVFEITDWGPNGKIVAGEEHPTFFVIFSLPVRSLKALDAPSKKSDIMSIEPALPGTFRWYGTNHLSFEADGPADPTVQYTIKIDPELKSKSGKKITGTTTFKTTAEDFVLINLWPGYNKDNDCDYSWSTGALPPNEHRFVIRTNYVTTKEFLQRNLMVTVAEKKVSFNATPIYKELFYMWANNPKYDEEKKVTNTFLIEITDPVPHNVTVKAYAKSDGQDFNEYKEYNTLQPFALSSVAKAPRYTSGKFGWPLDIYFTQTPDENTLIDNISFDFDFKLSKDNFMISGQHLTIYNLPLEIEHDYKIIFKDGIKDIYGQPCSFTVSIWNDKLKKSEIFDKREYTFRTPPEQSYAKFWNYGTTMLEAQFPHKMIFEHQNIISGKYTLQSTKKPIGNGKYNNNTLPKQEFQIDPGTKNERQFVEMDLDPYLNNGYGFVSFDIEGYNWYTRWWDNSKSKEKFRNQGVVQVTDLGITARIGINRSVVMVRSLSTDKPVDNADVYIVYGLDPNSYVYENDIFQPDNPETSQYIIAQGKTDSKGVCDISFTEIQLKKLEKNYGKLYVYVAKGNDKAAYAPSSHNSWRDGIRISNLTRARKPFQRTFMFVDRGVYRPGETVTFRGIDRDQLMGTFIPVTGDYTITSAGNWWNSKDIIEPIQGKLSSSGGFAGSFKLPDKLEPGTYQLRYKRAGGNRNNSDYDYYYYDDDYYGSNSISITFIVANFERVKFESSITVPEVTYFGGDKIAPTLSADYLAGGSLSGASYEATWYKDSTTFTSSAPEAKGFTFYNGNYSGRTYYKNDSGTLGTDGTAQLNCTTEKILDGCPYIYHVETAVTDVSNQRIAAQNDILVHPAQFYVGLKKARNTNGFAKVGQKLEFPYILVNPDGKVMKESDVPLKVSELEFTLTHEVWTMVHEQSVYNTIYTRYERSDVEDYKGNLKAVNAGILPLTLKEAGWYTLTVTGKDSKGNKVSSKFEFYATGSRTTWYDRYNPESITLTPDQSQYNPGETARILLESPLPEGDYLITVEREGIFTEEVKHFDSAADVIEIPIAGNYVPVVYVSVSSYSKRNGAPTHSYGEPDLDKPKGYYGVTPLFINPEVRTFSVKIECDQPSYKPGETATITFKATKGGLPYEGAELTAMAVDRGVLDLINYHVPNPIDFFYNSNNFPLRVYGGDSRALLMDPVTYSIKDLQGGDSDEEKENERKDFRPTAFFEPVLITDKNGEAKVTFKMPDSLTTYRITAFGVKDDLFALQEEEVKVQNPINIQQVQPRMLRERDTAECGVLISNLGKDGQKVTVTLEVLTPTEDTEQDKLEGRKTIPGKGFVDGEATHTLYVASGQSTVCYFDVVAQTQGTVNLVYHIKSDAINEKLISPIKIDKTFVYETVTMTGQTPKGTNAKSNENFMIPGYAKEGRGDLKFTIDATRLGMLGSSVNYLFDYPYGCLEQQSSRIMPLIAFDEYIDVFGLDSKVADIKTCVTSYTKKWGDYQRYDGGFGYWSTSHVSYYYVSLRIAHIYAMAMKRGYTPDDIPINIGSLKSYLINGLNSERQYHKELNERYKITDKYEKYNNYYLEAYTSYVLSLLGDSSDFYMNDLYENLDLLTLDTMAYLSLAYANSGRADGMKKAEEITKKIKPYLQPTQRGCDISPKARSGYWFWYRTETIRYTTILSALVTVNPDDEFVDKLIYTLLTKQSHGRWQSTITTAQVLDSIYTYIKMRDLDATDYTATVKVKGKQIMDGTFKGAGARPKVLTLPFEDEFVSSLPKDKSIPLEFEKKGTGYLFYTLEMRYALPDEMQVYRNEGLDIQYTIRDFETNEIINVTKDTTDITLETGKLYKANITMCSNRNRDYVALRAPIPSGAEILDSTFVTTGSVAEGHSSSSWHSWMSHKSILDNEVQFFWDELYSGSCSVDFTFRAVRRGIYPTPPVQAECMYEPEIFGRSDGYLFIIK